MRLLADDVQSVFGTVSPPPQLKGLTEKGGSAGLSLFFTNVISLIYTVALLAFLFMLIIGAFQWITSGGDKEAVSKARGRITSALIGLLLLALAFVIVTIIGQITGFTFYNDQESIIKQQEEQQKKLPKNPAIDQYSAPTFDGKTYPIPSYGGKQAEPPSFPSFRWPSFKFP